MIVHLVDGTYELYRQHYGQAVRSSTPAPNAATIGVLNSTMQLLTEGATYIGVASDHVIESFRNELWASYKTSEGMEPEILGQIPIMEEALSAMGVTVWPMVEYEADDALASAAAVADADARVTQVQILSPDKDLGQCVKGTRVVQIDRRKMGKGENGVVDEAALAQALKENRIAGAAVDVYSIEPATPDNPLLKLEGEAASRLLLTPHVAGVTRQSAAFLFKVSWENVQNVLNKLNTKQKFVVFVIINS
jgi:5'-3' exonuclease